MIKNRVHIVFRVLRIHQCISYIRPGLLIALFCPDLLFGFVVKVLRVIFDTEVAFTPVLVYEPHDPQFFQNETITFNNRGLNLILLQLRPPR